ncbi:MAG: hypothetical protein U9P72_07115 [Campylobacterota bacterium]|nr:hypothetical protein [Campylobacterota bacterium]
MKLLNTKSKTPLELTVLFIFILSFSYLLYHFFIYDYYKFILILSSFFVGEIFDMRVLNSENYFQEIKLVSNATMHNAVTNEISRVGIEFTKIDIDNMFNMFTKTPLILAFILLFARSLKTVAIASLIVIFIHTLSVAIIMTDIMLFASLTSIKLINYFQMFGITQIITEGVEFIAILFRAYIPTFIPLIIAYWLWETHSYSFKEKTQKELSSKWFIPLLESLKSER